MRKRLTGKGKTDGSPVRAVFRGWLAAVGSLGVSSAGAALLLQKGALPMEALRLLGPLLYSLALVAGAWLAAAGTGEGKLFRAMATGGLCLGMALTLWELTGERPGWQLPTVLTLGASLTGALLSLLRRRRRRLY